MTERDVFRSFYRVARMEAAQNEQAEDERFDAIFCAAQAELGGYNLLRIMRSAQCAVAARSAARREPSRNSVRNQMLVFTFGRLRRSA